MSGLVLSTTFCPKYSSFYEELSKEGQKCIYKYSCKVTVILVRFNEN